MGVVVRRMLRLGVLALAVSVVLVAAHAEPASARRRRRPKPPPTPPAPLQIENRASLSADHSTADVVLTIRCPTGATPSPIKVSLRQGGVSGSARSGTAYKCNGQAQRVVVPVTAGSGRFHTGDASATATASWHGSTRTATVSSNNNTSTNVQLV